MAFSPRRTQRLAYLVDHSNFSMADYIMYEFGHPSLSMRYVGLAGLAVSFVCVRLPAIILYSVCTRSYKLPVPLRSWLENYPIAACFG
jgi:hypothetical protein